MPAATDGTLRFDGGLPPLGRRLLGAGLGVVLVALVDRRGSGASGNGWAPRLVPGRSAGRTSEFDDAWGEDEEVLG